MTLDTAFFIHQTERRLSIDLQVHVCYSCSDSGSYIIPALLNIQRIMDMLGAQTFILCGEVVLFQRLFCIECVCIQVNI